MMAVINQSLNIIQILNHNGRILFLTRFVRLFSYGFLSVILVLYLTEIGLSETQFGLLLTLTLIGDTFISLWLTTSADRLGRKKMLIVGSLLMFLAGLLFSFNTNFLILTIAAIIGVISPSGKEVGPFLPIEQAALSHIVPETYRTHIFGWYNLVGSLATALGSLAGGLISQGLHDSGMSYLNSYRVLIIAYGISGLFLIGLFLRLSQDIETKKKQVGNKSLGSMFGLQHSTRIILKLSALFSIDAFAGGFIIQSIMAYWFYIKFKLEPAALGSLFFFANILAAVSALTASRIAKKIGLINTMFFTHLPSNIILILIPFSPNLEIAIALLLIRFSISQMDVPTRQSYTMAVVNPDERSAAAGITGVARTTGAAFSPVIAGSLMSSPALFNLPFIIAGCIKIIYDFLLYFSFRRLQPPEEIIIKKEDGKET
jgi:MFS family permease